VITFGSLFTGFGLVDVGAKAAGLELAWGLEYDPEITEVANTNLGRHTRVLDILEADPRDFERVDVLHASPPCTRASVANHSAELNDDGLKEARLDKAMAGKVVEFIEVLRPQIFTLENVFGYRKFQSWAMIEDALNRLGYWVSLLHVNAANFGVPQTRKRMIVRAVLGGWVPYLPPAEPWVGWYEAIEDLIPALPESRFAKWQLERLEIDGSTLVDSAGYVDADGRLPVQRPAGEPANTVIANHAQRPMRAFIANAREMHDHREMNPLTTRNANEPIFTLSSSAEPNRYKAFIVGGQYGQPQGTENRAAQLREEGEPSFTVTSLNKGDWRAWLSDGRVVAMTPRALARFQTLPDWYELPATARLACKGIGNGYPCLAYQKIVGQLVERLP